jgi:hypothetical protein
MPKYKIEIFMASDMDSDEAMDITDAIMSFLEWGGYDVPLIHAMPMPENEENYVIEDLTVS